MLAARITLVLMILSACACAQSALDADTIVPFSKIEVADGFSPNGDGWNDELSIVIKPWPNKAGNDIRVKVINWSISNTKGEVVFESTDGEATWNGKKGEEDCPMGSYYWSVTYGFPGEGEYTEEGAVLLIR